MARKKTTTTTALMRSSKVPPILPSTGKFISVRIDLLEESPFNPRKNYDREELKSLAESIAQQGIVEPLVVRENGKKYEIVCGSRRYRAAKSLGLTQIPVLVRTLTDGEVLDVMLVENLQREDLDPLEEAKAIAQLLKRNKVDDVAKRIGKGRSYVFARVQLLSMSEKVLQNLREGRLKPSHIELLAQIKDRPDRDYVAERVVHGDMTFDGLKTYVRGGELAAEQERWVAELRKDGVNIKGVAGGVSGLDEAQLFSRVVNRPTKAKNGIRFRVDWETSGSVSAAKVQKCLDRSCSCEGKSLGILYEKVKVDDYGRYGKTWKYGWTILAKKHRNELAGVAGKKERKHKGEVDRHADRKRKADVTKQRQKGTLLAIQEKLSHGTLSKKQRQTLLDRGVKDITTMTFRGDEAAMAKEILGKQFDLRDPENALISHGLILELQGINPYRDTTLKVTKALAQLFGVKVPPPEKPAEKKSGKGK